MRLTSLQTRGIVAINEIFSNICIHYVPKGGVLDYWGTLKYCLLSYYILSKYRGL